MSISQVRNYLKDRITEVDSNIFFWEYSFTPESIPHITKSRAAYIGLNELGSGPLDDNKTNDIANVELQLFFKQVRYTQDLIDIAYDVAHDIRMNAIKINNFVNEENIKNVVLNSMSYDADQTDNSVVIILEFSFYLTFTPN